MNQVETWLDFKLLYLWRLRYIHWMRFVKLTMTEWNATCLSAELCVSDINYFNLCQLNFDYLFQLRIMYVRVSNVSLWIHCAMCFIVNSLKIPYSKYCLQNNKMLFDGDWLDWERNVNDLKVILTLSMIENVNLSENHIIPIFSV